MFYQKAPYFTGDKIKIFALKQGVLNEFNSQFIITAMRKSFSTFSWGSMFNEKSLKQTKMKLPIKNSQPDYEYMATYIKAIQKLVIKGVVDFAEQEMQAYQQAITR